MHLPYPTSLPEPFGPLAVAATGLLALLAATVGSPGGRNGLRSPLRDQAEQLAALTYRQGRRLVILLLGTSVLLVGIAMIVLPGPALVVIPLGLAVLGIEFAWARRWLAMLRRQSQRLIELRRALNGGVRQDRTAGEERPSRSQ